MGVIVDVGQSGVGVDDAVGVGEIGVAVFDGGGDSEGVWSSVGVAGGIVVGGVPSCVAVGEWAGVNVSVIFAEGVAVGDTFWVGVAVGTGVEFFVGFGGEVGVG